MEIDKAIGIDLGTTNSCVGITDETDAEILLYTDNMGVSTTPSCVWYDEKTNQIVVGKRAFRRRGSQPPPVVSIKRRMGTMLLTPLGRANRLPENLPEGVARVLRETREERLKRYIARIEDNDPARRAAKCAQAQAEPPELWVFDQRTRIEAYLRECHDPEQCDRFRADPPLLWLPEEISALILAEERRQIAETLSRRSGQHTHLIERAVITVPAYFGARQIEATKEAGNLAGLQVVELLQEPTAAARYYCWKRDIQDGNFLVFDLGGGTFDVSVVRRTAGVFDTLGISGHNLLGGDDMDRKLAEWIRAQVAADDPDYDLDLDPRDERDQAIRNRFVLLAEGVKKALTSDSSMLLRDTTTIKDRKDNPVSIEMTISRETFEELITEVLSACLPKCWEALAKAKRKANVSLRDIDRIFLVGGSTHSPSVQKLVKQRFCQFAGAPTYTTAEIEDVIIQIKGDDERQTVELQQLAREMLTAQQRARCSEPFTESPDLCVALGAAISAASYGTTTNDGPAGASIEFLGARGTRERQIVIKGRVLPQPGIDLRGATASLTSEPTRVQQQTSLGGEHAFIFKCVALEERTHNRFQVSVLSPSGAVVAQAPITIEQNPAYTEVTTGLDSCATLSKAIYIDVIRQGRLDKMVLLESGHTLTGGAEGRRRLKVPEPNTGMLRFRIYQARRPLADVVDTIDPSILPGTPITFNLQISEDFFIRAHYQIGDSGERRSFVIEPPPPETAPSSQQVRVKNQQIEDALSYKSPVQAQAVRIRARRINAQLDQASTDGDDPKRIEVFHELDDLLQEINRAAPTMSPPWEEYDSLLAACRRLIVEIEKKKPQYPIAQTRETLNTRREAALAAYNAQDQQLYGEQWERLRETNHGLTNELQDGPTGGTSRSPAERAKSFVDELIKQAAELERAAVNFAAQFDRRAERPPTGETPEQNRAHSQQCRQAAQELAGLKPALERLKPQCVQVPEDVLNECHSQQTCTERWQIVLLAKQEILTGKKVALVQSLPGADDSALDSGGPSR